MIKEELYEDYRKQPREYLLRLLIESKCDIEFKRVVGDKILKFYEIIYFKNIKEDSEDVFKDKDSDFLFFLDLVATYVLDVPVMNIESSIDEHLNMLKDENLRELLKSFIVLKQKY